MTGPDILALGEPLMELVRQPRDAQPSSPGEHRYRSGVGGDALNVLVAAVRQGARAGLISAVGEDDFGGDILEFCRAEGIETGYVHTDPNHPTGFIFIDPDPVARRFRYVRAGSAASRFTQHYLPSDQIRAAKALHITGVTLAISTQMRSAAFRAAEIAKANKTLVSFDLNFRPKLWAPETAREVIDTFLPMADLIFPSEDECEELYDLTSVKQIAEQFGRFEPDAVIVKRGADGAVLCRMEDQMPIAPTPVAAVDSSGAGDSFAGAFLAHYVRTRDPVLAAKRASWVASETVTGWGATQSIPHGMPDDL